MYRKLQREVLSCGPKGERRMFEELEREVLEVVVRNVEVGGEEFGG